MIEEDETNYREWEDDAACKQETRQNPIMRGAWFGPNEAGDRHPLQHDAERICRTKCPVNFACLRDALEDPEAQGVRGGYEFDGGKLPVAKAREIRDTTGLELSEWQSTGRPKK